MQVVLLLQLLVLLVVANGAAVAAKKLLRGTLARPLDGGALFVDGRPVFGPTKTIRGIVVSVLATAMCAALMGLGWRVGVLIATLAMAGDLSSSFVKRRLDLASSSMAIGLDIFQSLSFLFWLAGCCCRSAFSTLWQGRRSSSVGARILSPLLFKLNLRDEPH